MIFLHNIYSYFSFLIKRNVIAVEGNCVFLLSQNICQSLKFTTHTPRLFLKFLTSWGFYSISRGLLLSGGIMWGLIETSLETPRI